LVVERQAMASGLMGLWSRGGNWGHFMGQTDWSGLSEIGTSIL
jgi:hypothetical protein